MMRSMLRAKIHGARVTGAELHYEGSIAIDDRLIEAADLLVNEKVHILNLSNGSRAETYVIQGERNSGAIIMNGAIARLAQIGDEIIILSYAFMDEETARTFKPKIIKVDSENRLVND